MANFKSIPEVGAKILKHLSKDEDALTVEIRAELSKKTPDLAQFKQRFHQLGTISRLSLALNMVGIDAGFLEAKSSLGTANESPAKVTQTESGAAPNKQTQPHPDVFDGQEWKQADSEAKEWQVLCSHLCTDDENTNLSFLIVNTISWLQQADVRDDTIDDFVPKHFKTAPACLAPYLNRGRIMLFKKDLPDGVTLNKLSEPASAEEIAALLDKIIIGETLESVIEYCNTAPNQNAFHLIIPKLCADFKIAFGSDYIIPYVNDLIRLARQDAQRERVSEIGDTTATSSATPVDTAIAGANDLGFIIGLDS